MKRCHALLIPVVLVVVATALPLGAEEPAKSSEVQAKASAQPPRAPMIFASPIPAGCKASNARTCQIVVEPFTITSPTAPGFVTLFAADGTRPLASSINFSPGQTRANNATLPLAVDATGFSVFNGSAGTVHFILDVNGFFE